LTGIYGRLLALWLVLFALEAAGIARWATALAGAREGLEAQAEALKQDARDISSLARQTREQSGELAFLGGLPNILPKDKGYVRTQRAIAEEVAALRRKLAPRLKGAVHVVVDAKANKLYLKKGFKLLWQADCSVGRGGTLLDKKTGRRWQFVTPRGEFRVVSKAENPLWRKPDWAYAETGSPMPPPDSPERLVAGELGAYLLNLGDGYLIHGTKDEASLGRPASHGCVRLGADDLKKLYELAPVGTKVYIVY
jgi:L,D-transpeptidase YbiS